MPHTEATRRRGVRTSHRASHILHYWRSIIDSRLARHHTHAVLKRRHIYVLLFAVPALLVSISAAAVMLAVSAGALWLFLFGDNPWPPVANTLLGAVFAMGGAALWLALLSIAWAIGKQQERRPTLSTAHVALAIGATAVFAVAIIGHLTRQNLFGTPTDSLVCADVCRAEGFMGSGISPANSGNHVCSCYDTQGREAARIDLSAAAFHRRRGERNPSEP